METRVQMADAQMQKMQRALERADQDKARLEQDLAATLAAGKGADIKVSLMCLSAHPFTLTHLL